jgi:hypothetical protein
MAFAELVNVSPDDTRVFPPFNQCA